MKIAVYTIAKNEAKFAERWARSCADADYRIVLDTGSTDDTVPLLEKEGVTVHKGVISPWRFDDARNACLALVPPDTGMCIALDMDEVLVSGSHTALLKALCDNPALTRPRYRYVWSWNADGSPGLTYHGDKLHARSGFRWVHPVHEVISPVAGEVQGFVPGLEIHHHPDPGKSRAQYLSLLELALSERPDDDRNQFYLGREYVFVGKYESAITTLERHLANPRAVWAPERAASMEYLAQAYDATGASARCFPLRMRAVAEAPYEREPWFYLLKQAHFEQDFTLGYAAAKHCLDIRERPPSYICQPDAWGYQPYDLGSLCAWYSGAHDVARAWVREALRMSGGHHRIAENCLRMGITDVDKAQPAV